MIGVFIKKRNIDTETDIHRGKMTDEDEGGNWSEATTTSQGITSRVVRNHRKLNWQGRILL